MERREPLYTVSGNVNWCSHDGKQHRGSSKIKNTPTMQFSNFTSGYIPKGIESRISKIYLYSRVYRSISQQPQSENNMCPLIEEGIIKTWCAHIIKYHSTLKRKKILT